jgi:hypothetical protein
MTLPRSSSTECPPTDSKAELTPPLARDPADDPDRWSLARLVGVPVDLNDPSHPMVGDLLRMDDMRLATHVVSFGHSRASGRWPHSWLRSVASGGVSVSSRFRSATT